MADSAESKLWTGIDWPPEDSLRCFIGRTGQNEIWWARFPPPNPPIMMKSTGLDTTTIFEVDGNPLPVFNWNVEGNPFIGDFFADTWFAAWVDPNECKCYVVLNEPGFFFLPAKIYGGAIESGQMWGQRKFLNLTEWFQYTDPLVLTPTSGTIPTGTLNFQYRLRGIQSVTAGFEDLPPTSLKLLVP